MKELLKLVNIYITRVTRHNIACPVFETQCWLMVLIIMRLVERRDDWRCRGAGEATLRIRGSKNSEFSDDVWKSTASRTTGRWTVNRSRQWGAATEKARVTSAVCVRGTVNSGVSEDLSNLDGGRSCSRSDRYGGDDASRVLNVKSSVLYRMLSLIGSQWRDCNNRLASVIL